jgi:hypothetical protein
MRRSSVATFSVLLVPVPSGIPVLDSVDADDLPAVGDLIRVNGYIAQVTHVWPGEQAAELRAIARPSPEGEAGKRIWGPRWPTSKARRRARA